MMKACYKFAAQVRTLAEELFPPEGKKTRIAVGAEEYLRALRLAVDYEILGRPSLEYSRLRNLPPEERAEEFIRQRREAIRRRAKTALRESIKTWKHFCASENPRIAETAAGYYREETEEFRALFPRAKFE